MSPLTLRHEVHGRLVERRGGVIVKDLVRHGSADTMLEARTIAAAFVSDGFTAWIYKVEAGPDGRPHYSGAGCFRPGMPTTDRPT